MSYALYNDLAGLRFWRQRELRLRERLKLAIVECVQNALLDLNQMWAFEEVEAPPMMPLSRMSAAYDRSDVFLLLDPPGGVEPFAMRAETTDGTYAIAEAIMRTTNRKPPLGFYQMGPSFRRETSDGATAAKLRFNAFVQLEFQLIHSADTKADIVTPVREALALLVRRATGSETRLIPSDRLPAYSTETVDIEVLQGNNEWREVASTSPSVPMIMRHLSPKSLASGRRTEITWLCQAETRSWMVPQGSARRKAGGLPLCRPLRRQLPNCRIGRAVGR